ncbi:hypothetical protein S100390_v1c08920 [Spiroplasma sp. NBRC 100390]|uniref:AIPR family protein n=1 Tax=unclassified Spiroplasma TaxID=2637901 RepID=UPI0008928A13|nr:MULTISPECIES: AIPR family protein [unclassified Spiroplasma]AOX44228.1 hypothetical protein STU14_v1c08920 [Spiroplasma sp. TU-14]APE13698.1 hypothetical protein S100390_v1c08920 [Spiroplasma sp. NBRC 100390]
MSNFNFYKKYNNNDFISEIERIESNINSRKFNFPNEIRKALEYFLDFEFNDVCEIKSVGPKINYIKQKNMLNDSILNKVSELNNSVKPYSHSGNDYTKVSFELKKDMLNRMFDIISEYKETHVINFNESIYNDTNKEYFSKEYSKQMFFDLLEEKEIADFECFELFCAKYLMDLDDIDSEKRVIGSVKNGGINLFEIDEETQTIKIGHCKYKKEINKLDVQDSFDKIITTIDSFYKDKFYDKNEDIKDIGANWNNYIEENLNVELVLYTSADANFKYKDLLQNLEKKLNKIIGNEHHIIIKVIDEKEIEKILISKQAKPGVKNVFLELCNEDSLISIDTKDFGKVTLAVIKGESLRTIYKNQERKGQLFEKNVRGYIKYKKIDEEINSTLLFSPEKFLILNNGLTIIGQNVTKNSGFLTFEELFIVNGAQTTSLIGEIEENKSLNDVNVFVKIIDNSNVKLVDAISEASNNQKPIKPVDLIANNDGVRRFAKHLENKNSNYALIYKRSDRLKKDIKIKNKKAIQTEELMKMYYSFVKQQPGTARSGFKKIIEIKANADFVFQRMNIAKDDGYNFFLNLMYINEMFELFLHSLKNTYKNIGKIITKDNNEFEFVKNGKHAIFAIIGATIYYLTLKSKHIENDIEIYRHYETKLQLSSFIKHNNEKDELVKELFDEIAEEAARIIELSNKPSSNFLKTDSNYELLFNQIIKNVFGARKKTRIEELVEILFKPLKLKDTNLK